MDPAAFDIICQPYTDTLRALQAHKGLHESAMHGSGDCSLCEQYDDGVMQYGKIILCSVCQWLRRKTYTSYLTRDIAYNRIENVRKTLPALRAAAESMFITVLLHTNMDYNYCMEGHSCVLCHRGAIYVYNYARNQNIFMCENCNSSAYMRVYARECIARFSMFVAGLLPIPSDVCSVIRELIVAVA